MADNVSFKVYLKDPSQGEETEVRRFVVDKEVSTSEMLVSNATQTLEEFYPSVAIASLMRIIRDPNLNQHHNQEC